MMKNEDFFRANECLTSRVPLNNFYLTFFGVLWRKMLIFFPIRSKMDSTGALVVRNRVSFPSEYFFHLSYNILLRLNQFHKSALESGPRGIELPISLLQ